MERKTISFTEAEIYYLQELIKEHYAERGVKLSFNQMVRTLLCPHIIEARDYVATKGFHEWKAEREQV
tara:strand:+ start:5745 stop:5948 length:204 start_codon:yes stop_codon:yes gene_type:complete